MTWKERLKYYEEDSLRIIEISRHFLLEYHHCSEEEVDLLMDNFFEKHESRVDEDYLHYVWSYRLAGLIYLTMKEDYSFGKGNGELINRDWHKPPDEAMGYFRDHYFDSNRNNPFNYFPYTDRKP